MTMEPVPLPQFAAIKSKFSGHYLCYLIEPENLRNCVCATEPNVYSPQSKIEFERARVNNRFVHIRSCYNNKYWARSAFWIHARANEPEEDPNNFLCTMFEPTINNEGVLYLTHVQSQMKLVATENHGFVGIEFVEQGETHRSFTVVDWYTLVILPKNVAFKGDNNMFLKVALMEGNFYLQFSSSDGNEIEAAFEVSKNPDGNLFIKSLDNGLYWRFGTNWIAADSIDTNHRDSLFWPVKVDDSTIALRSIVNNKFCKRLTTENKTSCLNASAPSITTFAKLKVEELVLERHISDVNYRVEDARIYGLTPVQAGEGYAENLSEKDATISVKVGFKESKSYSFKCGLSLKLGVKTSIETGFARIVEGKIEFSAEITTSLEWNKTETEEVVGEVTYTGPVPAKSRVTIHYMATKGACDVPFSYTQRDKSSLDGNLVTSQHTDGIYTGVNYYGFHFKQAKVEPI